MSCCIQMGGCPNCGRSDCVAGACQRGAQAEAIQAMAEGMAKLGVRSDMLTQAVSPIYKSIGEHPGFTAQGAHDAFVKQYTQNQLDAAIAAERERCVKLCEEHDKDCAAEGREHNAIEIAAAIRNPTNG